jgi:hypothetical protein
MQLDFFHWKIWWFFHGFFYISCSNRKISKLTKLSYTSLKSWLKNLSNEYIYAEQNPSKTRDIWFQSWSSRSQKASKFSLKFWLCRPVPENWGVPRGYVLWFFLSWGINYCTFNEFGCVDTKISRFEFGQWKIFLHSLQENLLNFQQAKNSIL